MTKRSVDHILIEALAIGATQREAARAARVSESTVYRRLRDPEFCRRRDDRCDQLHRLGDMAMLECASAAGDVLLDVAQNSANDIARVTAAKEILSPLRIAPIAPQPPRPPEPQGPSAVDVIKQRLAEYEARKAAEGSVEDSTDPLEAEK